MSPLATSTPGSEEPSARTSASPLSFDETYEQHFDFVWRSVRRLGVDDAAVDDVVQETFLVVHRRLADFEGRSSIHTWLFGILLRVARDHRRHIRRKAPHSIRAGASVCPETLMARADQVPCETAMRTEAVRTQYALLDELDDEKREVFILAELEGMTAPEVADALSVPAFTASIESRRSGFIGTSTGHARDFGRRPRRSHAGRHGDESRRC